MRLQITPMKSPPLPISYHVGEAKIMLPSTTELSRHGSRTEVP